LNVVKLFGSRKETPRLKRLRDVSLFKGLSLRELSIVDGLMHQRNYQADEVIFDEGEDGQAIYIVLEGAVLLCRAGKGEQGRIADLMPGAFFGDMALLDNLPRAAQARAMTPCVLAVYFREDFLTLMETHARIASKIALQLAQQMARRLRGQSELTPAIRLHQ
jgi:CRP/FNR family cyclic AMP-dependent transcriptional regulator